MKAKVLITDCVALKGSHLANMQVNEGSRVILLDSAYVVNQLSRYETCVGKTIKRILWGRRNAV